VKYLSNITERKNENSGYSCTGNVLDYTVNVFENGVTMNGSLCKSYFGDNIHTLTRRDVKEAIEKLSDCLHTDIESANVTRLDVSTIIYTRRPPADYYAYLGNKPYFSRLQVHDDTLQYNNHQRQIIFYDKTKEAKAKAVQIPEILQGMNLLRYELRYTKRLNRQLKTDLTAGKLFETDFYRSVIRNWHEEFKTIQKIKNQSIMVDGISTMKEAKEALFAHLLQQSGQSIIDEFLSELKAGKRFNSRSDYTKLKNDLNKIIVSKNGNKSDMITELETQIFDVARYAR
jgi:hypothetical protein